MSLPIEPKTEMAFSDDGYRGGVLLNTKKSENQLQGGGSLNREHLGMLAVPIGLYSSPFRQNTYNVFNKEVSVIGGDLFDKLFSSVSK